MSDKDRGELLRLLDFYGINGVLIPLAEICREKGMETGALWRPEVWLPRAGIVECAAKLIEKL